MNSYLYFTLMFICTRVCVAIRLYFKYVLNCVWERKHILFKVVTLKPLISW